MSVTSLFKFQDIGKNFGKREARGAHTWNNGGPHSSHVSGQTPHALYYSKQLLAYGG